jgi:hypothetical protein
MDRCILPFTCHRSFFIPNIITEFLCDMFQRILWTCICEHKKSTTIIQLFLHLLVVMMIWDEVTLKLYMLSSFPTTITLKNRRSHIFPGDWRVSNIFSVIFDITWFSKLLLISEMFLLTKKVFLKAFLLMLIYWQRGPQCVS